MSFAGAEKLRPQPHTEGLEPGRFETRMRFMLETKEPIMRALPAPCTQCGAPHELTLHTCGYCLTPYPLAYSASPPPMQDETMWL